MSKYCPVLKRKVTYLDCQECEEKECKKGFAVVDSIVIIALALLISLIIFLSIFKPVSKPQNEPILGSQSDEIEVMNNLLNKEEIAEYEAIWAHYADLNPDYKGQIIFKSNLINKPFVQTISIYDDEGNFRTFYDIKGNVISEESALKDACDGYPCDGNNVYLWKNFYTGEYDRLEEGGSVFMDYRNTPFDQNLIIYGHHFSEKGGLDNDRVKGFSALDKLMEEENYEENKIIHLVFENEIREYVVASVFIYNAENDYELQFYRTELDLTYDNAPDPEYEERYLKNIKDMALYDTDVEINKGDKLLTLQTCIDNEKDLREIVVAKEVNRYERD